MGRGVACDSMGGDGAATVQDQVADVRWEGLGHSGGVVGSVAKLQDEVAGPKEAKVGHLQQAWDGRRILRFA